MTTSGILSLMLLLVVSNRGAPVAASRPGPTDQPAIDSAGQGVAAPSVNQVSVRDLKDDVCTFRGQPGYVSDTGAVQSAIDSAARVAEANGSAAQGVGGGEVVLPAGRCLIGSPGLVLSRNGWGVRLVGAGRDATQLSIQVGSSLDGITFSSPKRYGQNGGLRNLSLVAPSRLAVRHMVYVNNWGRLEIEGVNSSGAGSQGLRIVNSTRLSVVDSEFSGNGDAGLYIGGTGALTTATRFTSTRFGNNAGAGADVAGLSLSFIDCIFESNGKGAQGQGLRIRDGNVTLLTPYFENNAGVDLWVGSDPAPRFGPTVTVINPWFANWAGQGYKLEGMPGVFFEHSVGSVLLGGLFYGDHWGTKTVVMRPEAQVTLIGTPSDVFGASGVNRSAVSPEVAKSSYPPEWGDTTSLSPMAKQGAIEQRSSQHVEGVWNPGSVSDGAVASGVIAAAGVAVSDRVVGSLIPAPPAGILITFRAFSRETVLVSVLNKSGSAWSPGPLSARIDIIRP